MMDHIIPFGALPQVYLYEHPQAEEDGVLECPAIVVMRRAHGFMAALPSGVFSDPELAEGAEAGMEALVGPSLQIQVSAALLTEEGPIPQPGVSLPCLLVDFSAQAAARFAPLGPGSDPEALLSFDAEAPDTIPEPSGLLQQALVWAQRPDLVPERVAFYSAEEEAPAPRKVLRLSRQDVPKAGTAGVTGTASQPPKPKRATTATLASQLQTITAALPGLTAKLEEVASKQQDMEARIAAGPAASLKEPLGTLGATPKALQAVPIASLGPPPGTSRMLLAPQAPLSGLALEAEELQQEGVEQSNDPLARAVLAQSQALTALVSQLAAASSDPVLDLGGQGVSTRGAAQRAKLQEELASGRGSFFAAVLGNMARRMSPAATASTDPAVLHSQGVCLSRYWERFGGFGSAKDLALRAPSGDDHGCLAGGKGGAGPRPRGAPCCLPRAGQYGRWEAGPWEAGPRLSFDLAGGAPQWNVSGPAGQQPPQESPLHSFGKPALGHRRAWVSQRNGGYPKQEAGYYAPKGTGWRSRGSSRSGARSEAKETAPKAQAALYLSAGPQGPFAPFPPASGAAPAIPAERPNFSPPTAGAPLGTSVPPILPSRFASVATQGANALRGRPEAPSAAHVASTFGTTISFFRFAACLPRWILKTGTPFAAFLASTFDMPKQRVGTCPSSATFPLPVPSLGIFRGSGPHMPRPAWKRLVLKRLLHVVVCALNFVHDGHRWPNERLL